MFARDPILGFCDRIAPSKVPALDVTVRERFQYELGVARQPRPQDQTLSRGNRRLRTTADDPCGNDTRYESRHRRELHPRPGREELHRPAFAEPRSQLSA